MRNDDRLDQVMRTLRARVVTCIALTVALCAAPLSAQSASLAGTVVTDPEEKPIANAEIVFAKLNISGRTDEKGNFIISGVPSGKQEVIVRRIGYEPVITTMMFNVSQKVEVDFMLKPVATKLDKVNVKASADPRYTNRLRDFEDRRQMGLGKFLTADFFADQDGRNMSSLLSGKVTGLGTVGSGASQVLIAQRGQSFNCRVQVIINGIVRYNGTPLQELFDVNSLIATNVIGLEYYTSSTTPIQFMGAGGQTGGSQCGTVVIWTK